MAKKVKLERYPIDPNEVEKGTVISAATLEKATGVKRTSRRYQLKLLALCKWIERQKYASGSPMRARIDGDTIRVMEDNEASEYAGARHRAHVRAMLREFVHMQMVDENNLTDGEVRDHRKRTEIAGRYTQAVLGVRGQIELEATTRKTPKMIDD